MRQSKDFFRVDIDGHLCFEYPKISIPAGYELGVTAASAENADSFEVFKLVTTTESMTPDVAGSGNSNANANANQNDQTDNRARETPPSWAGGSSSPPPDTPADEPASSIPVSAQFADLHNRLQGLTKYITALNRDVSATQSSILERYNTLEEKITRLERALSKFDSLSTIDKKLAEVQADVRQTKTDLHSALDRQVQGLKTVVRDGHRTMLGSLPGVMGYVLVGVAGQGVTVLGYLVYKRRKNAGPKKYL